MDMQIEEQLKKAFYAGVNWQIGEHEEDRGERDNDNDDFKMFLKKLKESEPKQPTPIQKFLIAEKELEKDGGPIFEQPSEGQTVFHDEIIMFVNQKKRKYREVVEFLSQYSIYRKGSEGEGAKPDGRETGDNSTLASY